MSPPETMPDAFDPRSRQPQILMCPPDYYGIEYEIKPWMSRQKQADTAQAARQWSDLRNLLEDSGAKTLLLDPVRGLPDLVFTANAAMIYRDAAVLARFRYPQRQAEEPVDEAWLARAGFTVRKLPDNVFFEGAGDALFCGDTLFAGYRIRSDVRGHQQIGEMFSCRVIPLELIDPYYYHLDTCFCPLAPGLAIYFPAAFDDYGRQALAASVDKLIEVDKEEARRFACNAVVVGRTVVTNFGCPRLHASLRERGFTPRETPLDEFVKAGGSAKCLTLRLDGEEAASWKSVK
jgi:N-dimethylarginine dimethylaminohydrolase